MHASGKETRFSGFIPGEWLMYVYFLYYLFIFYIYGECPQTIGQANAFLHLLIS